VVTGLYFGPLSTPITLSYGPSAGLGFARRPDGAVALHDSPLFMAVAEPTLLRIRSGRGWPLVDVWFPALCGGQTGALFTSSLVAYAPPSITGLVFAPFDTRGGGAFNITGSNVSDLTTQNERFVLAYRARLIALARSLALVAFQLLPHTRQTLPIRSSRRIWPARAR